MSCSEKQNVFQDKWRVQEEETLIDPAFLSYRKQDWHLNNGRLETTENVNISMQPIYLGEKEIESPLEAWSISVEAGWQKNNFISEVDSNKIGFLIGIDKNEHNIKSNYKNGFFFGVESNGRVIVKELENTPIQELTSLENTLPFPDKFLLTLSVNYKYNSANMLFEVQSLNKTETYAKIVWVADVKMTEGNIALVADLIDAKTFRGCWFNNFSIAGNSIASKDIYSTS